MARQATQRAAGPIIDPRTDAMTDEQLLCRRLGHRWDVVPAGRARRQQARSEGVNIDVLRCGRCTLQVVETSDYEWDNPRRGVDGKYPDGYLVPKGSGRLSRAAARRAWAARAGRRGR